MSWIAYLESYVFKVKPESKASVAMEKSSSGEKAKAKSASAGIAYAASSPSEVSDDSSSSAAAAVRGRDSRARLLARTGSSSSLSSGVSISPPGSRKSSPLRNSLSKACSPGSSRPATPDLIGEEDEAEGQTGSQHRVLTSASESSLASSMAPVSRDQPEARSAGKQVAV